MISHTWELNDDALPAHLADTLNVTKSADDLFTAVFELTSSARL